MRLAIHQANLAAQKNEIPVGAVIVHQNELVAEAHNQPISDSDPSSHAEMNVLRLAGKKLSNYRLPGLDLYVTLEPCLMCAGAIMNARISRVFFGAFDPKTGVAGSVLNVFNENKLNHHAKIEGGILGEECAHLLKDFFRMKRSTS
ncbi:tRNA adenosine(34) deaminase TadA [Polynucleobacter kasalickyi]|uniref:tRNA-specific adenosine deaminase n=1 Tax=Polynucleobacter kasalickyi TaxID=1938817 RepID=A0A1W2BHA8_9BURK|nr:tRNA adenosine(34) deaminase TadA [Polynucleobacter kasalickyi]SMC71818.1 tRNA-adenosine deaminase [Polynucleobacter kasalickyi]